MGKKHSTTKSETQSQGSCRNIFKVFRRRISQARPIYTDVPKPSTNNIPCASNKLLIEYNHSNNEPTKPGPINIHQQPGPPKGVKFQGGYNDEKFSDYIDQVKNKIKANSSFVVDEENGGNNTKRATTTRRDSFNDRVSHFINRAKLKRRSTTTTIVDHGDAN